MSDRRRQKPQADDRVMKAWTVAVRGCDDTGTCYGPTASKARYTELLRLRDCMPDIQFQDISVRRRSSADIVLPPRHRLVDELSAEERRIVLHAYGYDGNRPENSGYRDHYCTNPGDSRLLRLAWEFGLFAGPFGDQPPTESMWVGVFFYLTDLGKLVARSMVPAYGGTP